VRHKLARGLAGKFMIERLARLPVEVDYGSEFRYRDPILDAKTLTFASASPAKRRHIAASAKQNKKVRLRAYLPT